MSSRWIVSGIDEVTSNHFSSDGALAVIEYAFAEQGAEMITCVVDYIIDPREIAAFETFARKWIELVNRHGGRHHGYFLPSEGASDRSLALFSFPSLSEYEKYRSRFGVDEEFIAADRIRDESGCVLRYVRSFMRPLFDEPSATKPSDAPLPGLT